MNKEQMYFNAKMSTSEVAAVLFISMENCNDNMGS